MTDASPHKREREALHTRWQEETIELDVDVNEYLPPGLAVDDTCATPVTLARLLTHTSGFTEAEAEDPSAVDRSQTSSPGVEVRRSPEHRNTSPTKSEASSTDNMVRLSLSLLPCIDPISVLMSPQPRPYARTPQRADATPHCQRRRFPWVAVRARTVLRQRGLGCEQDSGVWGAAAVNSSSLTRHLRSNPLTRVSPTGTLYCDCEHNYLLIGSLIEHTSKLPFQRYMAARCVPGVVRRNMWRERGRGLALDRQRVTERQARCGSQTSCLGSNAHLTCCCV